MNIIIKLLGSIKRLGIIVFIEKKYNNFLSKIYVASISNRLKGTKRFSISFGHKVFISGPEGITLGEGVIIGWGSRVECVRRWAGDEYNPDLVLGSYSVINPLCLISGVLIRFQLANIQLLEKGHISQTMSMESLIMKTCFYPHENVNFFQKELFQLDPMFQLAKIVLLCQVLLLVIML